MDLATEIEQQPKEEQQLEEDEQIIQLDANERKAKQYAKEHPEVAADLIKAWLNKK